MNRDKIFFPKLFPYYYKIAVDSEDNILVFLNNWIDNSEVTFQVYSKDGQYICTTRVNSGNFEDVYPSNFYKNFFFATLERKDGDDLPFLARIILKWKLRIKSLMILDLEKAIVPHRSAVENKKKKNEKVGEDEAQN